MKSFIKKILLIVGLSLIGVLAFGQNSIISQNAYIRYLNAYKNGDTLKINKTYSLSPVRIYNRLLLKNYYLPLNKGAINQVLRLGAGDSLIWVDGTNLGNWSLTGNAGTDTINNFIGSTDNSPIIFKVNNQKSGYIGLTDHNTYFGAKSGSKVYDGEDNTYIGYMTGYINYGNRNTFIGSHSAFVTSIGNNNIFLGYFSGHNTDSLDNRLIIGSLIKNNSHEDTTLSIIYGKQDQLTANQHLWLNANVLIKEVPVSTSDSLLVRENKQVKYKVLDMSPYLRFIDTTSTLLTQSKATNTYQLKYWSKTGTAITPYTSTDTVIAPYIRLKNIHTTGTVLTEVTSTGLLDTIATTPINPIYVKKAGDTMGGSLIMNSGSILFDDYAFASGDKVAVIHESGLLDTATTVTIDNADINTITISDSIRIGGLWYIGDTVIIADEDSITIPVNRSMFGQIFVDSAGYMVAYANSFYVDINGTPHLISNSSRVIATNTDTNAICLYAYAGNLILRNRSGSTLKYKIILNG